MRIVLDTNVLVSALLNQDGNPAAILDAVLAGKIQLVVDDRMLAEYEQVLRRPKFNLPVQVIEQILQFISFSSIWVRCSSLNIQEDRVHDWGDLPFAEVAVHGSVDALVTGNMRHFIFLSDSNVRVMLPQEFVAAHQEIFRV